MPNMCIVLWMLVAIAIAIGAHWALREGQRQERLAKRAVSPTPPADSKAKPQPLPAPAAANKQALKSVAKS